MIQTLETGSGPQVESEASFKRELEADFGGSCGRQSHSVCVFRVVPNTNDDERGDWLLPVGTCGPKSGTASFVRSRSLLVLPWVDLIRPNDTGPGGLRVPWRPQNDAQGSCALRVLMCKERFKKRYAYKLGYAKWERATIAENRRLAMFGAGFRRDLSKVSKCQVRHRRTRDIKGFVLWGWPKNQPLLFT